MFKNLKKSFDIAVYVIFVSGIAYTLMSCVELFRQNESGKINQTLLIGIVVSYAAALIIRGFGEIVSYYEKKNKQ